MLERDGVPLRNPKSAEQALVANLVELGLPQRAAETVTWLATEDWMVFPRLSSRLPSFDAEDWYSYFVDIVVQSCLFRPTKSDILVATEGEIPRTLSDFVKMVTVLVDNAPDVASDVRVLDPCVCSGTNRDVWTILRKLHSHEYNDQFALKCMLDKSILAQAKNHKTNDVKTILNRFLRPLCHYDLEDLLQRNGYWFSSNSDFAVPEVRVGDILKVSKELEYDEFRQFGLVTVASNGLLECMEFKPRFGDPLAATYHGVSLFFLRGVRPVLSC